MGGAWTHLPCQSHRGQLRWRQAVTTMAIHQQAGSAGPPPPLAKTHIPVMPRTPAFHSHLWTAWPPAIGLLHAPGHVCPCRGYTAHLHRALREQYSCTYLVVLWRQYEELWTGLFFTMHNFTYKSMMKWKIHRGHYNVVMTKFTLFNFIKMYRILLLTIYWLLAITQT